MTQTEAAMEVLEGTPDCESERPPPTAAPKYYQQPFCWYDMTAGLPTTDPPCDYDPGWVCITKDKTVYANPRYRLYVACPDSRSYWRPTNHVDGQVVAGMNSQSVFKTGRNQRTLIFILNVFENPFMYLGEAPLSIAVGEESLWAVRNGAVWVADSGPIVQGGQPQWQKVGTERDLANPFLVAVGRKYMTDDVWVLSGSRQGPAKLWTLCPGAAKPWQQVQSPDPATIEQLGVGQDGTVFAVSKVGDLYQRSDDGTWQLIVKPSVQGRVQAGPIRVVSVYSKDLIWAIDGSCRYWKLVRAASC